MNKVPVVPGLSRMAIERAATSLLRKVQTRALGTEMPVDIEAIYEFYIPEHYGIEVGYTDLSQIGFGILGYTDASTKRSYVDKTLIDSTDTPTIRRCRATIGHETGHCILHVPILNVFKSTLVNEENGKLYRARRSDIKPYLDPEWQAWEFAQSCLMPYNLILDCVHKGFSIRNMAEYFDVNPAFIRTRLRTLGIQI